MSWFADIGQEDVSLVTDRSLKDRLRHMLEGGEGCDVTFTAGRAPDQQEFHAHQALLAASSDVFKAMFFGPFERASTVHVPDISPDAFRTLLRYIYIEEAPLQSTPQACCVLYAAKKYMLSGLAKICRTYLTSSICENYALELHNFLRDMEGEEALLAKCKSYLRERTEALLKGDRFLDAEEGTVKFFLEQDYLAVPSETTLLNALNLWAAEQCKRTGVPVNGDNKREVLAKLLPFVRFLSLTPLEFVSMSYLTEILSPLEYSIIISNLVKPGVRPMPAEFSKQRNPRTGSAAGRRFR